MHLKSVLINFQIMYRIHYFMLNTVLRK